MRRPRINILWGLSSLQPHLRTYIYIYVCGKGAQALTNYGSRWDGGGGRREEDGVGGSQGGGVETDEAQVCQIDERC